MLDKVRYRLSCCGVWFRHYLAQSLITFAKLFGVRLVRTLKPGE